MQFVMRTIAHQLRCHCQHGITRQYGCSLIPSDMHSRISTPHVGPVHDIIMKQCEVMKHLYSHGLPHSMLRLHSESFGHRKNQHRTQPLASTLHGVLNWVIQSARLFGIRHSVKRRIYILYVIFYTFHYTQLSLNPLIKKSHGQENRSSP